jgi:SAM-dependent methyltransferase
MTTEGYKYEGTGYLEIGEDALRNYNASIAAMVVRYGAGAVRVMDFGAGIGTLSDLVRANGIAPLCLEPDPGQRAALERRGFRTAASLDDVADGSLDYVYSSNVLEHIADDVQALRELRRTLRPGGRLLLYVPAFQSLFSSLDVTVGHHRRYDRATLGAKLRDAAFEVDDLYYADFFGYFVTAIFKLVGNTMANANPLTLRIYDRGIFPVGRLVERLIRVPVGKNVVGVATKPAGRA